MSYEFLTTFMFIFGVGGSVSVAASLSLDPKGDTSIVVDIVLLLVNGGVGITAQIKGQTINHQPKVIRF